MTVLRVNTIAGTGTTFGPLLDGNLEFNSQNYIILPKGTSSQEGVLRNTADVVGTGGTFYDNLVLAMPFNAATGLTDVSSRNRNPAAYGNVAISTAQSKYYGSSAYFDGSGDYIDIPTSTDFGYGTGDFTIEFWCYLTSIVASTPNLIDHRDGTGANRSAPTIYLNSGVLTYYTNGGNQIVGSSLSINTWTHISLCRSGGITKLFANGVQVGSNYNDTINYISSPIRVFADNDGVGEVIAQPGYIQDLRIYKGIAKYTSNFTPPDRIAEVGVGFKTGQLRYNTDSNKVELYDGNQWTEVQSSRPDLNGGARGLFAGGRVPGDSNVIDYITISSTGNAIDFGDLSRTMGAGGGVASSTRGLFAGGTATPLGEVNIIDYITIASTGNAQDFGDLTQARQGLSSCASSTRGLFISGITPSVTNVIDYVTIASIGNAVDFGDLLTATYETSACSSPTRGIIGGGIVGPSNVNTINYITISTLGNSIDFGDLTTSHRGPASCSNATRGLFSGGYGPASQLLATTSYVTISTLGNSVNFGDRTIVTRLSTAASSLTRGTFAGGLAPGGNSNVIDYFTISTQSNAIDFGDLTVARHFGNSSLSNAHGGL